MKFARFDNESSIFTHSSDVLDWPCSCATNCYPRQWHFYRHHFRFCLSVLGNPVRAASVSQKQPSNLSWSHLLLSSVGNLRYRLPQALPAYTGNYQATQYGPSCPQQLTNISGFAPATGSFLIGAFLGPISNSSEDCESESIDSCIVL